MNLNLTSGSRPHLSSLGPAHACLPGTCPPSFLSPPVCAGGPACQSGVCLHVPVSVSSLSPSLSLSCLSPCLCLPSVSPILCRRTGLSVWSVSPGQANLHQRLLDFTVFYFTLLYSSSLYSTLVHFTLFWYSTFYSTLLNFTLHCSSELDRECIPYIITKLPMFIVQ